MLRLRRFAVAAEREGGMTTTARRPALRLRRFAVVSVPGAADAAGKAYRGLQGAQARPSAARVAPVVAPGGRARRRRGGAENR